MKNKTKRQKIKKAGDESRDKSKRQVPRYWFYMSENLRGVREIYDCLDELDFVETEIWEGAGVLEVILSDGHSIDMETGKPDLRDEYSRRFLEEHQIKALFYVTIVPESYKDAEKVMVHITKKMGGFFCGDTEDFSPFIGGEQTW